MFDSRTGVTRALVFVVMVTTLRPSRALYIKALPLTFCEALRHCRSLDGRLPVKTNIASLQDFMNQEDTVLATWLSDGDLADQGALIYCNGNRTNRLCPGLVALPVATEVLKPPLANCTHSSVDVAVCKSSALTTLKDWLEHWFPMEEIRGRPHVGRPGSFCDAVDACEKDSRELVESNGEMIKTDMVQEFLDEEEKSSCWSVLDDVGDEDPDDFCDSLPAEGSDCPAQIILQKPAKFVKGSIVGCDTTLPVICDIPERAEPTSAGQTENGKDGRLALVLGTVAGLLVFFVIIIIVIVVIVRKNKCSKPGSDVEKPRMGTLDLTFKAGTHGMKSSENENADINDDMDPPVSRTVLPLSATPPPIGGDPGYMEIPDRAGDNGGCLGYEDINGPGSAHGLPPSVNLKDELAAPQDEPNEPPLYTQPIKSVPSDDVGTYEAILVENTVYE